MTTFISILIFFIGAACGSFLSVLIPRLKEGEKGIIRGRSACPHCQMTLKWHDLIPLISYLFLKGKCRSCKKTISPFYPAIELMTAAIFMIFFGKFYQSDAGIILNSITLALYWIYALILILTFFYDLKYMEIPDKILLPGILLALTATIFEKTPHVIDALIGAAIPLLFFGFQILVSGGRWMGGGDLRIGAFMGLILGWKLVILALILSYIAGSIIAVTIITTKRRSYKSRIPFGPFLVLGTWISMLYGEKIIDWYFHTLLIL